MAHGYAYVRAVYITYSNVNTLCKHVRIYITSGPHLFYIKTCLLELSFIVKYTLSDCPN